MATIAIHDSDRRSRPSVPVRGTRAHGVSAAPLAFIAA